MGSVHKFTRNISDFSDVYGNGITFAGQHYSSGTYYWYPIVEDAGPGGLFTDVHRISSTGPTSQIIWCCEVGDFGAEVEQQVVFAFRVTGRDSGGLIYLGPGRLGYGDSTNTICQALRITLGATSDDDVIRFVEKFYASTFTELGSNVSFSFDTSKWYSLRMHFDLDGNAVKAKIWELDTEEPVDWTIETTGTKMESQLSKFIGLYTYGTRQLDIAYFAVTDDVTSYPLSAPSTTSSDRTGDGEVVYAEYVWLSQTDLSVFVSGLGGGVGSIQFEDVTILGATGAVAEIEFSEAALDGYGNFRGDVEHSEFVPDGYGNFEGSVEFPGAELAGESWVGGIGVIDFPEFGIHQAISGNGEIHEDTRDLFDYTGRSGALGSVSFSMGLRATGSQLVSGNAETSFGTFILDGDGNFSGTVSFEDTLIDASGSSFPVGRASIDWSISVGGAGKVGTVEAGSSPVEFPAFQISGAGTVRVVGHAAMDFERFEADGVALPGCSGDGVIVLPSPVVLASGQHPPRGDGAIEFSIDLPSSGCYGHSDRYRYPILRFERHP